MAIDFNDPKTGFHHSGVIMFINQEVLRNGGDADFYLKNLSRSWNEVEDKLLLTVSDPQASYSEKLACAWSALALGVRFGTQQRDHQGRRIRILQRKLHEQEAAACSLAWELQNTREERRRLATQLRESRESLQHVVAESDMLRERLHRAELWLAHYQQAASDVGPVAAVQQPGPELWALEAGRQSQAGTPMVLGGQHVSPQMAAATGPPYMPGKQGTWAEGPSSTLPVRFSVPAAYQSALQYPPTLQYPPAPQYQLAPQYQPVPQYQLVSQYQLAPEYQAAPQYQTASQYQPATQYQAAAQYQPASQYQLAPQYQPASRYQLASQYQPAPQYQSAPEYQSAAQYQPTPQYQPAPACQSAPQYQLAPQCQPSFSYPPPPRPGFVPEAVSGAALPPEMPSGGHCQPGTWPKVCSQEEAAQSWNQETQEGEECERVPRCSPSEHSWTQEEPLEEGPEEKVPMLSEDDHVDVGSSEDKEVPISLAEGQTVMYRIPLSREHPCEKSVIRIKLTQAKSK